MDMGTRTAARIAAQGDFLTLVNFLPGRYQNFAQMTVAGLFAVRMTDSDTVSIPSGPACADDGTAAGRSDCRSCQSDRMAQADEGIQRYDSHCGEISGV